MSLWNSHGFVSHRLSHKAKTSFPILLVHRCIDRLETDRSALAFQLYCTTLDRSFFQSICNRKSRNLGKSSCSLTSVIMDGQDQRGTVGAKRAKQSSIVFSHKLTISQDGPNLPVSKTPAQKKSSKPCRYFATKNGNCCFVDLETFSPTYLNLQHVIFLSSSSRLCSQALWCRGNLIRIP